MPASLLRSGAINAMALTTIVYPPLTEMIWPVIQDAGRRQEEDRVRVVDGLTRRRSG